MYGHILQVDRAFNRLFFSLSISEYYMNQIFAINRVIVLTVKRNSILNHQEQVKLLVIAKGKWSKKSKWSKWSKKANDPNEPQKANDPNEPQKANDPNELKKLINKNNFKKFGFMTHRFNTNSTE
jgi:hypothetical protein